MIKNTLHCFMEIHMKLKSIFSAALISAVAYTGTTAAANLNVALYNPNNPGMNSYVVDLGVSYDDLATGANTGFSTNIIDTISNATMDTLPSLATFEYTVFGLGETVIPEFGGFPQDSLIVSSNTPGFTIPVQVTLQSVFNNAETYLGAQDFQNFVSENAPGTPGFYEAINFNGNFGNQTLSAETVVGMTLDALLPVYVGDFSDALFNFELADIGDFLLSEDGTFTYSTDPVTVIPVPAAVWLFGSALIGGVARYGRRRNASAA